MLYGSYHVIIIVEYDIVGFIYYCILLFLAISVIYYCELFIRTEEPQKLEPAPFTHVYASPTPIKRIKKHYYHL